MARGQSDQRQRRWFYCRTGAAHKPILAGVSAVANPLSAQIVANFVASDDPAFQRLGGRGADPAAYTADAGCGNKNILKSMAYLRRIGEIQNRGILRLLARKLQSRGRSRGADLDELLAQQAFLKPVSRVEQDAVPHIGLRANLDRDHIAHQTAVGIGHHRTLFRL